MLHAAERLGIDIPVFCAHEKLVPAGLCRMCLVEVEGYPKLQTSCTLEAGDGMVVHTDTQEVVAARRHIIEFLLINHPLDCPVCDKGGECPLQDLTMAHGPGVSRVPLEWKRHWDKPIGLGQHILLDRERCIQCGRCVRFCDEIAHHPVLGFRERTFHLEIHTTSDPPFDSQFSGNTVDICPVGALTARQYRFRARPWDIHDHPSICALCGCGCNIILQRRHGRIVRILPARNEAINEVWLCDTGRFGGVDEINSADRLLEPQVREDGDRRAASWEEALERAAAVLTAGRQEGGIVVVPSPRCTCEEVTAAKELAEAVGGEVGAWPSDALASGVIERGLCTARIADIERADGILLLCADVSRDLPIVDLKVKKAVHRRGARLAVVHPEQTEMEGHAVEVVRAGPEGWPKGMAALEEAEKLVIVLGSDGVKAPDAVLEHVARLLLEREGAKLLCVAQGGNTFGLAQAGLTREPSIENAAVIVSLGAEVPEAKARLIYVGSHDGPTAKRADVALPGASFAEKNGTIVNTEGVAQQLRRAARPPGSARDDTEVLRDLIRRLPR